MLVLALMSHILNKIFKMKHEMHCLWNLFEIENIFKKSNEKIRNSF